MKKIIIILVIYNIIFFNSLCFAENNIPNIYADSAIVYSIDTGQILYQKNINKKQYPASITKILTALIAMENNKLDNKIIFSKSAVNSIERGSSHLWIVPDEVLTVKDSLYGLLLKSANEIANGLAEKTSGTMDAFIKEMNNRAKKIGCTNTNFITTNGLHDPKHYTTAYDMALIATEAFKNDTFKKIISTTLYTIPETNKNKERIIANSHKMLKRTSYHYDGCLGGKTGYTSIAGNTLVTFAKRDNMTLVSVVLKSNSLNIYKDSTKLLNYGFTNYKKVEKTYNEEHKIPIYSKNKIIDYFKYKNNQYISYITDINNINKNIDIVYDMPKTIASNYLKNEPIGKIKFYFDSKLLKEVTIKADKDILVVNNTKLNILKKLKSIVLFILKLMIYTILSVIGLFILFIIFAKLTGFKFKVKKKRDTNFYKNSHLLK